MMRVVLKLVSGSQAGRQIQLLKNQRLQVGSTARADFVVRGDQALAGQHFSLETDHQICRVRSLGENGTLVNGQPVELAVVRNGDEITAGHSKFRIEVEGDAAELPAAAQAEMASAAVPARPPRKTGDATYKLTTCDTGIFRYEGSSQAMPPAELAAALAAESPLYMIADNRRLQNPALEEVAEPKYLFDWLGASAPGVSPLIISPGDVPDPLPIIEKGWKKDGLVCVFATSEAGEMVQRLRGCARVSGDKVLGICWPSVLGYLLSHYRGELVPKLMQGLAAILIEDAAAAEVWAIYSTGSLEKPLDQLNLKAAVPSPAAP